MKEALLFDLAIKPYVYLLVNVLGMLCFLYASYRNQWSKGLLFLSAAAGLSIMCRIYTLLAFTWEMPSLRKGEIGRALFAANTVTEYLSILCYLCGAWWFATKWRGDKIA